MLMDFDHPPADPLPVLKAWIDEAWDKADVPNPNAMTLCTVSADGAPHARIVLLKDLDRDGAVFFTNQQSAKGKELEACPKAALVLHWDKMGRQVRIEGRVERTSDEVSDHYFQSRHPISRLGAIASAQSQPCPDRDTLMQRLDDVRSSVNDPESPPRPPHWGGYRVSLDLIELWQEGAHRLHDRVQYRCVNGQWTARRLYP